MKKSMRLLAILLAALMVVGIFAACAKQPAAPEQETKQEETKQEETKQEETKQEETKQEETKQEEQPAEEDINETGVLKLLWFQKIGVDTLFEDPWQDEQSLYPAMIFDSLLHEENVTRKKIPGLASEWTVSDDLKTFTFTMRDDAFWSDGEPVTAEDVLWTFNTECINPTANYQGNLKKIVGYEEYRNGEADSLAGLTIDGNKIIVETVDPAPLYERDLGGLKILPSHLLKDVAPADLDSYAPYWSKPVGCGQYVIDQVSFPDYFTAVRNDNYYGEKAGIKNVQFVSYDAGGNDAVVAAIINGDIDYCYGNAVNDNVVAENVVSQNPDVVKVVMAGTYTRFFAFNIDQRSDGNNKPDLAKKEVRQAFNLIIDQPTIASFYGTQGTAFSTMTNPGIIAYNKDIPLATKDIAAAKALLDEAGFDYSQTIDIAYYYDDATTADIMALLTQDFAEAGITVNAFLLQGDLGTLIYTDKNYDLLYAAGGFSQDFPCSFYGKLMANTQYNFIGDEETRVAIFDELYKKYEATLDEDARREIGYQLQALDAEYRYFIPAYGLNSIILYNGAHVSIPESCFQGTGVSNFLFEDWSLVG